MMKELMTESMSFVRDVIKTIPLIFLQSESEFFLGGRAKQRLFQPVTDPYSQHAWVYAAVNSISLNVASVPYVFQNDQGIVRDSRWQKLFEQPNSEMGWGQFIEALMIFWHLRGEYIIILDRDSLFDMPTGMMPVDPAMMEPVLNERKTEVVGWKVAGVETNDKFALHEILQVKFFNPNDPFRGLSPLAAAQQGITQDALANRFNTTFYQNSGNPGGVVEVDGNFTNEQFSRFRTQLRDRHEGVNNAHRMMLLEGGARYKQLSITQKDMEFLSQKKWNRDEILAVFKVPKMEVGVWDDVNFAIAKVQAREFWLKNLIPKMDMVSWGFWSQLFSKVGGGRTWAEFDTSAVPALQDELETKVDIGFKMWQMGWTANQINKRLGLSLPENKWQNQSYLPVNVQPVDEDGNPVPIEPNRTNPAEDPFQQPQTGNEPKSLETNDILVKLKKFFYNQRVRQLKMVSSNKPLTITEKEEIEKLSSSIGVKESTALQLADAINYVLHQHVRSDYDQAQVKEAIRIVYNEIERKLPELIELLETEKL